MITHKIKVPIGSNEKETKVVIKGHDTGHRLQVFFEKEIILSPVRSAKEPYKIPEGSTVVLKIIKPNDTYVLKEGKHTDRYATFECPPESFTVLGKASAEINIYKDGHRITSATFYIDVLKEAADDSTEESKAYVDVMAAQINVALDAAARAEAAAKRAEEAAAENGGPDPPVYEGELIFTPSADNEITVDTAQKLMPADIVIEKIPYSEVSNNSNGTTVTIG